MGDMTEQELSYHSVCVVTLNYLWLVRYAKNKVIKFIN
jgi:hypothetical protein